MMSHGLNSMENKTEQTLQAVGSGGGFGSSRPFGCKCQSMDHRVLGDGCDECNPELAAEIKAENEADMLTFDEIDACENMGCAANKDGQCIRTGSGICYGYFPPNGRDEPRGGQSHE